RAGRAVNGRGDRRVAVGALDVALLAGPSASIFLGTDGRRMVRSGSNPRRNKRSPPMPTRVLLAVLALVLATTPARAAALSPCQLAIGKSVEKYVKAKLKAIS